MINIFIVFGTRPEFIKLVEVIKTLNKNQKFKFLSFHLINKEFY